MGQIRVFLAVVALSAFVVGCSDCEAKCIGPHAEVAVANDLAAVEVCDTAGVCTRQEFGPSGSPIFSKSFQLTTAGSGSKVSLKIRGFSADGSQVVSGQATAKTSKGKCGCSGPAEFYVDSTGVHV